jgi:hypothetical protein
LFSNRGGAVGATLLTFSDSSSNSIAAIPIVCALKLCSTLAMLFNNSNGSQNAI